MDHKDAAFDNVELLREECVEQHGEEQSGDDQERSVPALKDVPGVVENKQALDLSACEIGSKRDTCLPTKNTEPAYLAIREITA